MNKELKSVSPCRKASSNFVAPAKGGPIAMNFLIFGIKSLFSLLIRLFNVIKVPKECATIITFFPVIFYKFSIWNLNIFVANSFVAMNLLKS